MREDEVSRGQYDVNYETEQTDSGQMDRPAAPQYVSVTHRDCCF